MQAIDAVAKLLSEANAPRECIEEALEFVLNRLAFSSDKTTETVVWDALRDPELNRFRLKGPVPELDGPEVRISRVMTLQSLVAYYLAPEYSFTLSPRDLRDAAQLITSAQANAGDFSRLLVNGRTSWVTLEKELNHQSEPRHVCDALGGVGFGQWTAHELVVVSYSVRSADLHVPTCFDAAFDPAFVPKQLGSTGIPRAWDWRQKGWGLPEFVHGDLEPKTIIDPAVRLLGTPTEAPEGPDFLEAFSLPAADDIRRLTEQILRQVTAHRHLGDFLWGGHDALELTPREFELFVARLYERAGFHTRVTPASRDGGIDIIAIGDYQHQQTVLIQAKRTQGVVGIRVIRELIGTRFLASGDLKNAVLAVVTTGRFSRPAQAARDLYAGELELVDYLGLRDWLHTYAQVGVTDIVQTAMEERDKAFGRDRAGS